jgi:hypothetical protein
VGWYSDGAALLENLFELLSERRMGYRIGNQSLFFVGDVASTVPIKKMYRRGTAKLTSAFSSGKNEGAMQTGGLLEQANQMTGN